MSPCRRFWREGVFVWARCALPALCLLIIGLVTVCAGCRDEHFNSRSVVPSDSNSPKFATRAMEPIKLRIAQVEGRTSYGSALLVVPKAYLRGEHWKGTPDALGAISIEAALPELRPWTFFGEDLFEKMLVTHKQVLADNLLDFKGAYHRAFFRDWVTIRVKYGHCFGVSKAIPSELERWGQKDHAYVNPVFEKIDLGRPAGSLRSMYVPLQQGRYNTYIECPEWGGETRRCRGITDYDAVVAFEYFFSISRLYEFRDVEANARRLLDSSVQRVETTESMPGSCR